MPSSTGSSLDPRPTVADLTSDTDPYGSPAADPARLAAFQKLGSAEKRLLLDELCVIDAPSWAQVKVGMTLDPWQRAFLRATGNTAVVAGRRVGKTSVVGVKAAHHIAVARELRVERTALVIAPSLRQAVETTRAARAALAKALPDVEFASDNKLQVELPWGARLIALPGEAGTSRGFTASMAIAEESQSLQDADEIFATIAPTLATTGGPLIVVGTPMDYQDPLHAIFEGEQAHDPSWTRFRIPTRWCPRVPRSFLDEQRRLLGEAIYSREFEAQWSAPSSGMFDADLLQGALLPDGFQFNPAPVSPPRRYGTISGLDAAIATAVLP